MHVLSVYIEFVLPSTNNQDSLPETDSGSNTHQLLLKIKDQERKLDQQQKELVNIRSQLEVEGELEGHARHVGSLQMDLKKKICEVDELTENIVKLQRLKNDVPLYDMSRNPHGLAVIIVNGEFSYNAPDFILQPRRGAREDADCFSHTFTFLNYRVKLYNNLTASEMEGLMLEVGSFDHTEYDSFVCCVSSHGNQFGIYGSDSKLVHRNTFIDPIKSCASLREKPKLFFFQACRVPQESPNQTLSPFHCDSDILIANASTESNPAYSSPQTGSWFANAIKLKLRDPQIVHIRTLQQILEEVTNVISQTTGKLSSGEVVNQCVEVTTSMRKGVKFFTS